LSVRGSNTAWRRGAARLAYTLVALAALWGLWELYRFVYAPAQGAERAAGTVTQAPLHADLFIEARSVSTAEHGIEARRAAADESRERGFTFVSRIVADTAIALRHPPPFVISR